MKAYGEMRGLALSHLTSALDGSDFSVLHPGRFTTGDENEGTEWAPDPVRAFSEEKNLLLPQRIEPRTVHPIA